MTSIYNKLVLTSDQWRYIQDSFGVTEGKMNLHFLREKPKKFPVTKAKRHPLDGLVQDVDFHGSW